MPSFVFGIYFILDAHNLFIFHPWTCSSHSLNRSTFPFRLRSVAGTSSLLENKTLRHSNHTRQSLGDMQLSAVVLSLGSTLFITQTVLASITNPAPRITPVPSYLPSLSPHSHQISVREQTPLQAGVLSAENCHCVSPQKSRRATASSGGRWYRSLWNR